MHKRYRNACVALRRQPGNLWEKEIEKKNKNKVCTRTIGMPVSQYTEGGCNIFVAFAEELLRVGLPMKSKIVLCMLCVCVCVCVCVCICVCVCVCVLYVLYVCILLCVCVRARALALITHIVQGN
jgi:hypothetical protein